MKPLKLSLGLLMVSLAIVVAYDITFEECEVDASIVVGSTDLIDPNGVNVFGCNGSFIIFDMAKIGQNVSEFECEFQLGDDLPDLTLDTFDSDSLAAKSEGPNAIVSCTKHV